MALLSDQVHAWITRQRMLAPGDTVVVGVSGGPDSLCLLHVLVRLREQLGIALHVAHLDHRLRGEESAAEARFVAQTARAWELPATVEAIDVRGQAQERHANLHQAARAARYRFLAATARAIAAHAVAVAHNADDQAETVLMHLLRGAGPAGLGGMRPVVPWEEWGQDKETRRQGDKESSSRSLSPGLLVSPSLIRPLLTVTRAEIERYCAEHQLEPRRDPTNADLRYTRNRIRHDLMPKLVEYNPHVVAALGRTAEVCAAEHAFVQQELAAAWPALARLRAGAIDFAGAAWRSLHPALQREALRQAYALLQGGETLDQAHVEAARAAVERGVGRRIELPGGLALQVGYAGSFTLGAPREDDGPQLAGQAAPLPVPGRVALEHGWVIAAKPCPPSASLAATPWEVYLDAGALAQPLLVRRRRAGDRMRPSGGRGSRRLQDLLVDAKVPRALRDAWPLVTAAETIIWVAGVCLAEGFAAAPDTAHVVKIWITPPDSNAKCKM